MNALQNPSGETRLESIWLRAATQRGVNLRGEPVGRPAPFPRHRVEARIIRRIPAREATDATRLGSAEVRAPSLAHDLATLLITTDYDTL